MRTSMWKPNKCTPTGIILVAVAAQAFGIAPATGSVSATSSLAAPSPALPAMTATSSPPPYSVMFLEVNVAGMTMSKPALIVKRNDGLLLASADDLLRWRIRVPVSVPLKIQGKDYFPLDSIAGLEYRVDELKQVLVIRAPADAYLPTHIATRASTYAPVDQQESGAFLNYDLQLQQMKFARLNGLLELGVFNDRGFGTNTVLAYHDDRSTGVTRLETAWTIDQPSELSSLRLGDTISRQGAWGRSIRMGGVQWGTSFSTRPDVTPFQLPSLAGEAQVPSVVDLYVNNILRLSRPVPYGPFTIPDLPVFTGDGQVRMVVRDLLGREHVITQPYYVTPTLLQKDLHDYTYEAGWIRRNFGTKSNEYGNFAAIATHRLGLTEQLTGEARAELEVARQAVGMSASHLLPGIGILNASAAVSLGAHGAGSQWSYGFERNASPFGFGFSKQVSSSRFGLLGALPGEGQIRQMTTARASYSTSQFGTLSLGYIDQDNDLRLPLKSISLGYSISLPENVFLSLYGQRTRGAQASTSIWLSLMVSCDANRTASAGWSRQNGEAVPSLQIQQNLPQGSGMGYRLTARGGTRPGYEADSYLQTDIGNYSLGAAKVGDATAFRAGMSGGVALLDGTLRMSRRLNESFAVVKVGDYPDVEVLVDNQPVARTDAHGFALLPSLRPYQKNDISIRQEDLPMDTEIGALRLSTTLGRRSGAMLAFPVRRSSAALLRIVLENGSPMPVGAVVRVNGQPEEYPVAWRGEAYVKGLERDNVLEVSWNGEACTIKLAQTAAERAMTVREPLACVGINP
ncbi:MAG: fimbria/pilus outer membrane usher protein [Bacteroidota bacterium]